MENCITDLQERQDNLYETTENIEDLQDTWDQGLKNIQEAVMKKAEEEGITKKLFYEFNEFDI